MYRDLRSQSKNIFFMDNSSFKSLIQLNLTQIFMMKNSILFKCIPSENDYEMCFSSDLSVI